MLPPQLVPARCHAPHVARATAASLRARAVLATMLALLAAAAGASACGSSGFSSSAQKRSVNPTDPHADVDENGEGDDTDGADASGDGDADARANGGKPGSDVDARTSATGGKDEDAGKFASKADFDAYKCLAAKAKDYNVVLVFDNSGSQTTTDPAAVRREGANLFIDRFATYVQHNAKAVVRLAVFGFNTTATPGRRGWVQLDGRNQADAKDEVLQATSSPAGGTAFSPALRAAAARLASLSAPQRASARNVVVFLTDGLPNAAAGTTLPGFSPTPAVETMADIPAAVDALVAMQDTAIVAVASGAAVPALGETIAKSLAKPVVNPGDPSLVGAYHRAATPDALRQVWDALLQDIGGCH
jgi:hypothetical protein